MDNFELEAAMESGEFDAVMSEIKRIDDEAKKKGAYIFHPDKYLQYMKMVKLAKKIEEAEPDYEFEYVFGLPNLSAGIMLIANKEAQCKRHIQRQPPRYSAPQK